MRHDFGTSSGVVIRLRTGKDIIAATLFLGAKAPLELAHVKNKSYKKKIIIIMEQKIF